MKVGVDVSQLAYQNTGVANYLKNLVTQMAGQGKDIEFILFFSSLRADIDKSFLHELKGGAKVTLKKFKYPPTFLDFTWNRLHIFPIENFIGKVDVFITSDWTEPPVKNTKKIAVIYDLAVFKFPQETAVKIVNTQKRKLEWVKLESDLIITISESSKRDIMDVLKIPEGKIKVVYPGV